MLHPRFARTSKCFCGVDPDLLKHGGELDSATHCLMECSGDSDERCGGFDEMNVYEIEPEVRQKLKFSPIECAANDASAALNNHLLHRQLAFLHSA